ncbi:MAG: polysaccharide pyruvyl transferase CsaB [Bacillota bacterium]|nr:polysaccharide pyruvyl transferase CsaB [Bacillota bacterium]
MARVVISGYYGLGNAGDEAVLSAIVQALRRRDPEGEITVLSADPSSTREIHGVEAVSRTDLRAIRGALVRADLLISGGGSLLQDVTSLRSLIYYLGVVALARWQGVPVFFYAQGVGPLRRPLAKWLVARVVEGVAGITVRDPASAELLRAVGVRRTPVRVTADPVFAFRPDEGGPGGPGETLPGRRPVFGFAFRPWPGEETWLPAVARAAGELARRYGAEIRWLCFQPECDLPVARALQAACPAPSTVEPPGRTPAAVFRQVARCDLVVAGRLHALIMGAVAGRPVAGVSYDPKVDALLAELGLQPAGRLPGVGVDGLVAAAGELWEQRGAAVADLAARVAALRARAEATADLALACARSPAASAGRIAVLGVGVDAVTLPEAVQRLREWIEAARAGGERVTRQVVTLNPEIVMAARRRPALAEIIGQADLVTADGVGVVWAARRLGRPLPGRVTGADLVEALLEVGAQAGWHFYFLGAAPGVAEEAARAAVQRHPGLQVAGARHGYFPAGEAERVAREVAATAPDVLLVALGSPAQEEFIARHRRRLRAAVAIGVGGTLDVLAGRTRRAPAWLRRAGLEWLYRIARDPRRLKRALAIPAFVSAVLRQPRR